MWREAPHAPNKNNQPQQRMGKTIIMWMAHSLLGHVGNKADNTLGGFLNSTIPQRQPMVTRTRSRQWDVIETNVNERYICSYGRESRQQGECTHSDTDAGGGYVSDATMQIPVMRITVELVTLWKTQDGSSMTISSLQPNLTGRTK
jgi:hypothetical protein